MGFLHPMRPPIAQLRFPAQILAQLSQHPGLLCDQRRPVDTRRRQRDLRRIGHQVHDNFFHFMSLIPGIISTHARHFAAGVLPLWLGSR